MEGRKTGIKQRREEEAARFPPSSYVREEEGKEGVTEENEQENVSEREMLNFM